MQKNMQKNCQNMHEICIKYVTCNEYDKYAKIYDKHATWIYYGKYARKYAKYAKSADYAQKCNICTPHLADVASALRSLWRWTTPTMMTTPLGVNLNVRDMPGPGRAAGRG